ncbi:MAG: hypothetical protein SGPRY_011823, partial [Prymnesium sp.]
AGTFHSVCLGFLRKEVEGSELGYTRRFSVYDADQSLGVIRELWASLDLSGSLRTPKPSRMQQRISAVKNGLLCAEEELPDWEASFFRQYEEEMRRLNAVGPLASH